MSLSRLRLVFGVLLSLYLAGIVPVSVAASHGIATASDSKPQKSHAASTKSTKAKKSPKNKAKPARAPKAATSPPTHKPAAVRTSNRCSGCDRDAKGRIVRSRDAKRAFERATGYPHGRP